MNRHKIKHWLIDCIISSFWLPVHCSPASIEDADWADSEAFNVLLRTAGSFFSLYRNLCFSLHLLFFWAFCWGVGLSPWWRFCTLHLARWSSVAALAFLGYSVFLLFLSLWVCILSLACSLWPAFLSSVRSRRYDVLSCFPFSFHRSDEGYSVMSGK